MARAKPTKNGSLEEAVRDLLQSQAKLVHNQALLVAQKAEVDQRLAEYERQNAETNRINSERFARIESILVELTRIIQALPDAVREKIGFKPPQQP
ncbi:MAG TPA: hypothetical protein VKE94_22550 [Gemmataceae bacterium]|nr:hypothetical protein [Gemmataceae bacterium]